MIKNTLLTAAIIALVANIYVVVTNPPGPIVHRRANVHQPHSYRKQLETQFHVRYGQELSRLQRQRPNTLRLHLAKAGADRAMRQLEIRQGSLDPAAYELARDRLLLLQSEANHNLEIGLAIHEQVSGFIKKLEVFGTTRLYMGDIDPETLDRTYRGNLTLKELEEANADLEALIMTFRVTLPEAE